MLEYPLGGHGRWAIAGLLVAVLAILGLIAGDKAFTAVALSETETSRDQVVAVVSKHVDQWLPEVDPLMTLEDGTQVKSSNVLGVEVEGVRYYYRTRSGFSYDPLSRGVAREYVVIAVLDHGTQWEVEIFRLK